MPARSRATLLLVDQRSISLMLCSEWWVFRGAATVESGCITVVREPKVFHWTLADLLASALEVELVQPAIDTSIASFEDGYWRVGPTAPALGLHSETALFRGSRHFLVSQQGDVFHVEELRREGFGLFKGDCRKRCKSLASAARHLVRLAEESAGDCRAIKAPPKPLAAETLARLIERKRAEADRARAKAECFREAILELYPPVIGRSIPILVSRTRWVVSEGEIGLQPIGPLVSGSWSEIGHIVRHVEAYIGQDLKHDNSSGNEPPDNKTISRLLQVSTWRAVRYFECTQTTRDFRALEYQKFNEWFGSPSTNEIMGVSVREVIEGISKQAQGNRRAYLQ